MILVVGSTGMLGMEICRKLVGRGYKVRGLVRETSDPIKVQQLKQMQVETVVGDLHDRLCYDRIITGIASLICTASSMPYAYDPAANNVKNFDLEAMSRFITYANDSGLKRIVYTSFSGNIHHEFPLQKAKRKVETMIRNSGMIYTILRPSYFMEAWLSPAVGFDSEHGKVQVYGAGDKEVSYISLRDVAGFAVESLTNPFARKNTLELGGPKAITQLDAVKIFEKVRGTGFQIHHLPVETIRRQMESSATDLEASFAGLQLCLAEGDRIDMSDTLGKFMERLTSVEEFAQQRVAVH